MLFNTTREDRFSMLSRAMPGAFLSPSPPGFAGGEGGVREDWSSHVPNPPHPALSPAKPRERVEEGIGLAAETPNTRRASNIAISALLFLASLLAFIHFESKVTAAEKHDGKLRIIVFGAHPDDAELKAGGTAMLWAKLGHHVKFVSVTNGDIGHWQIKGEELAKRRLAEVKAADKQLVVEAEVLPIHDAELEPTLENRRTITRLIRGWKADT